jgi:hypothetical protein
MTEKSARETFAAPERCITIVIGIDQEGVPLYCYRASTTNCLPGKVCRTEGSLKRSPETTVKVAVNQTPSIKTAASGKTFKLTDAMYALDIAVGKHPYSEEYDMNHDGKVDSLDAREILKISVQNSKEA